MFLGKIKIVFFITIIFMMEIVKAQDYQQPIQQRQQQSNLNQPKEFENFKDRLYFGGTAGAWFGQTTYVNVSPFVGIKITEPFSVGLGFTYNYFSQMYAGIKYSSSVYGTNIFGRYFILDNFFAQVGWDKLSVPEYASGIKDNRAWVDNILVGGGYRSQFTDRASFAAIILYNVNQTPLSPYQNPIVQIGFNIGL